MPRINLLTLDDQLQVRQEKRGRQHPLKKRTKVNLGTYAGKPAHQQQEPPADPKPNFPDTGGKEPMKTEKVLGGNAQDEVAASAAASTKSTPPQDLAKAKILEGFPFSSSLLCEDEFKARGAVLGLMFHTTKSRVAVVSVVDEATCILGSVAGEPVGVTMVASDERLVFSAFSKTSDVMNYITSDAGLTDPQDLSVADVVRVLDMFKSNSPAPVTEAVAA